MSWFLLKKFIKYRLFAGFENTFFNFRVIFRSFLFILLHGWSYKYDIFACLHTIKFLFEIEFRLLMMSGEVDITGRFDFKYFILWSLGSSLNHLMKHILLLYWLLNFYYSLRANVLHHLLSPVQHVLCLWLILFIPFYYIFGFIGSSFLVKVFMSLCHSKLFLCNIDFLGKYINEMWNSFSHRHLIVILMLRWMLILLLWFGWHHFFDLLFD